MFALLCLAGFGFVEFVMFKLYCGWVCSVLFELRDCCVCLLLLAWSVIVCFELRDCMIAELCDCLFAGALALYANCGAA